MKSVPFRPDWIYRIFVQDVGRNGYSALADIHAVSKEEALDRARKRSKGHFLVIPHSRKDLWPDDRGRVPDAAFKFQTEPIP